MSKIIDIKGRTDITNFDIRANDNISMKTGGIEHASINSAGTFIINNTNSSLSVTSGALIISGGVGIGQNINVDSNANIGGTLTLGSNGTGSYAFPTSNGEDGNVLTLSGGNLIFAAGGADSVTALNDFGTDNRMVRTVGTGKEIEATAIVVSSTGSLLNINDLSITGELTISDQTAATDSSTGAIVVSGGVGIGGDLHVGGSLNTDNLNITGAFDISDTTTANGATSGALTVQGGVGIADNLDVGTTLEVGTTSELNGAVSMGSTLSVTSDSTMTGSLIVKSTTEYDGTSGALIVEGGARMKNLTVGSGTESYSFPSGESSSNQVLLSNNDGNLEFSSIYNASLSTGVLTGGVISPNDATGGGTLFSITDGTGLIVSDDPLGTGNTTVTSVSWTGKSDITPTNIGSQNITWISINSSGNVLQSSSELTNAQKRSQIFLGVVVHVDQSTINAVDNEQDYIQSPSNQISDLSHAIGFMNLSGNVMSSGSSGLKVEKTAGEMFGHGANYSTNPQNPHVVSISAVDTTGTSGGIFESFQIRNQDGSSSALGLTDILPNVYDDGSAYNGSTPAVPASNFTVQRWYMFVTGEIKVQLGQTLYTTMANAEANLTIDSFTVETSIADNGLFIGYMIVQQGMTDWNTSTQFKFISAGKFGALNGGGSISTLQETYDASTSPEIVTNSSIGGLTLKRGSATDTDNVLEIQNGSSSTTMSVDGNGVLTITDTTVANTDNTTGSILTHGGISALLNVDIGTTLEVGTTSTLKGSVSIEDTTTANGATSGSLTVAGGVGIADNLDVGTTLEVGTTSELNGAVSMGSTLSVTGASTMSSTLIIADTTASTTSSTGALVVQGGLGVGGKLNTEALDVVGATTVNTFSATGASTISSTLIITDATASTNSSTGALVVQGGLGIGGVLNAESIDAELATLNNLSVTSDSTMAGDLDVSGSTTLGGTLEIDGITIMNSTLTVTNSDDSSGATTGASIKTAGGLSVAKNLYVGGDFIVEGTTTTVNSTTTSIVDPVFKLAENNPGDTYDFGFYGEYRVGGLGTNGTVMYSGFHRVGEDSGPTSPEVSGKWILFDSASTEPGALNVTDPGTAADLVLGGLYATTVKLTPVGGSTASGSITLDYPTGSNYSIVFPGTQGDPSNVLINDGDGNLSWGNPTADPNFSVPVTITDTTVGDYETTAGALVVSGGIAAGLNLDIGTTLQVGTTSTFSGTVAITDTTASTTSSTGALIVSGGVGIGGDLYVGGSLNTDNLNITGALDIPDTTAANGATSGALTVQGGISAAKNLDVGTTLEVGTTSELTGAVSMGSTLSVTGASTMSSTLIIADTTASTTSSTGALVVQGGLGVGGKLNTEALDIVGATTLNTLNSSGASTLGGAVSITDTTAANGATEGALIVSGGVGISDNLDVGSTLEVGTTSELNGAVSMGSTLSVTSASTLGGTVKITDATNATDSSTGALVVSGGVGIGGDVHIGGTLYSDSFNLTGALDVPDTSPANGATSGALTVQGGVGIAKNMDIGTTLEVGTTSELNGAVSMGSTLNVSSNTTIGGTLQAGNTSITGTLNASSNSTLGGTLIVSGTTTMSSTVSVTSTTESNDTTSGALIVSGGVGIAKNLYVGGDINITNLSANGRIVGKVRTVTDNTSLDDDYILNVNNSTGSATITLPDITDTTYDGVTYMVVKTTSQTVTIDSAWDGTNGGIFQTSGDIGSIDMSGVSGERIMLISNGINWYTM